MMNPGASRRFTMDAGPMSIIDGAGAPAPVSARVYYAPALVAFVGGGGFSVGVSMGGGGGLVGWFPLGPREAYYPSYQVSPTYIRQVNVTNTRITNINVTNINVTNVNYVNRNAIVAMPQNSFASAQPVQRAAVRVDPNQMRQAQVIGAAPKVVPQRESVLANSRGRKASAPAGSNCQSSRSRQTRSTSARGTVRGKATDAAAASRKAGGAGTVTDFAGPGRPPEPGARTHASPAHQHETGSSGHPDRAPWSCSDLCPAPSSTSSPSGPAA